MHRCRARCRRTQNERRYSIIPRAVANNQTTIVRSGTTWIFDILMCCMRFLEESGADFKLHVFDYDLLHRLFKMSVWHCLKWRTTPIHLPDMRLQTKNATNVLCNIVCNPNLLHNPNADAAGTSRHLKEHRLAEQMFSCALDLCKNMLLLLLMTGYVLYLYTSYATTWIIKILCR